MIKKARIIKRNWWCPERGMFQVPHTWSDALRDERPVGGHLILAVDAEGNGHIIRSPDFRNPKTVMRPPHYGHSKKSNALETEHWRWMCNTLLILWWSYLPQVPPVRSLPPKKKTRYHDVELLHYTHWVSRVKPEREPAALNAVDMPYDQTTIAP